LLIYKPLSTGKIDGGQFRGRFITLFKLKYYFSMDCMHLYGPAFAPSMEIKVAQGRLFLCLGFMLPKPESTCLNPHQVMDAGRSWGPSRFDKVLPAHDPEERFFVAMVI